MTLSTFAEFGLLIVLLVFAGFCIPTLLQLRRTARAVEEFVRGVGPQLESATTNLDSMLGRVNRVAGSIEAGTRGLAQTLAGVGSFMATLRPTAHGGQSPAAAWLAALASLLNGLLQAWNACTSRTPARNPQPAKPENGGEDHVE